MRGFVLVEGPTGPFARKVQTALIAANALVWGLAVWGAAAAL